MASYCPVPRPSDWHEPEPTLEWRKAQKAQGDIERKLALIDEVIGKALIAARPITPELLLAERFRELADKWEHETSHVSSVTKRVMHPCYQMIIGMGPDVVPLLIEDMQANRRDWFWALSHLTNENPVTLSDAGHLDRMIDAWVVWGRKHRGA